VQIEPDRELPAEGGAFFHGSSGLLYHTGMRAESIRIAPESRMQELANSNALPEPSLPRIPQGIVAEWLDGIRSDTKCGNNFANHASNLSEIVLLGNLAIRTGEEIRWNSEALQARDCPAAEAFIRPQWRDEWTG